MDLTRNMSAAALLAALYANPRKRVILGLLAKAEGPPGFLILDRLVEALTEAGRGTGSRQEALDLFHDMDSAGLGTFTRGTRGHATRFRLADGVTVEALLRTAAAPPPEVDAPGTKVFRFEDATLRIPVPLTVSRISQLMQGLGSAVYRETHCVIPD
jgi:hypothetical protein